MARDANRTLDLLPAGGLDGSFVTFAGGASVAAGGVGNGLFAASPAAATAWQQAELAAALMPFVGGASVAAGGLGNGLLPVAGGDGVAAGGTGSGLLNCRRRRCAGSRRRQSLPGGSLTTPGSRAGRPRRIPAVDQRGLRGDRSWQSGASAEVPAPRPAVPNSARPQDLARSDWVIVTTLVVLLMTTVLWMLLKMIGLGGATT